MKTVRESTTLYNFLGSHNPYWRLTESSDVLRFSTTETTEPERTLQLSAEQAARIREMTVITSSLMMSLTVDESDLSVHLVGRKINKREWAGNASAWHDTPAVARDLSHGLSFAEQVVQFGERMGAFIGCSCTSQFSPPHQNAPPPVRSGIANRSEYTLPGIGMKSAVSQGEEWFKSKSVRICEPFLVVFEGGRFTPFAKVRP